MNTVFLAVMDIHILKFAIVHGVEKLCCRLHFVNAGSMICLIWDMKIHCLMTRFPKNTKMIVGGEMV